MHSEQFESVHIVPQGVALPTEHGKRWLDCRLDGLDRFWDVIRDVLELATVERKGWAARRAMLVSEGVPQAMASGISQTTMPKIVDHVNSKTAFTIPSAFAMALGTAAPTSTTTGAWGTTESSNYTGYARLTITASSQMNAATAATPSVATNSAQLQFAACTASSATELGFLLADSATIGAGNALWFGSLTSVTINTTQTPPTIATGALSLSLNTT